MNTGSNLYKDWSREQLLVLLQELSSENAQLQIELERARLERDRALIDTRLLEMNSQMSKRSPGPKSITGSTSQGYSTSSQVQSLKYPIITKSQGRPLLKKEKQRPKLEPRANTDSKLQRHSFSTHRPPSVNALMKKPLLRLSPKDSPQQPSLASPCPLPPVPGEMLNDLCLRAFTTFTDETGKMTDVENYFKVFQKNYAVPSRRVLIARLRALGERGELVPLMGKKRKQHQVYRLPIKGKRDDAVIREIKRQKLENGMTRKRYFIFCKHCECVFYLTPLMKGNSFQHTCVEGVITRNLKVRGKMCTSTAHQGPCIRLARGREKENVRNERYVRLCDRTQMYLAMKNSSENRNLDELTEEE
jgi:hypothetical protein